MRALLFCVLMAASPAYAQQIEILSATPASISLGAWCPARESCHQAAFDVAQAHCASGGLNARFVRDIYGGLSVAHGARHEYRFECSREPAYPGPG